MSLAEIGEKIDLLYTALKYDKEKADKDEKRFRQALEEAEQQMQFSGTEARLQFLGDLSNTVNKFLDECRIFQEDSVRQTNRLALLAYFRILEMRCGINWEKIST